ncbi:MAG: endonuclease domain-containing protein [Opitutaceae bacterium]
MPDVDEERLSNLPSLKYFRKKLRSHMTPAEAKLWTYLKNKQIEGRKFRRQHSVDNYILDFYCPASKLAIELDGQAHDSAMATEYDHERTLFLQATNIRVIRFENKTIFDHPEWVLEQIRKALLVNE